MGKRKIGLLEADEFYELVDERYRETVENPLCRSKKRLGGALVEVANLADPRTGDKIMIAPQRRSHFVDIVSEQKQTVRVSPGVEFTTDPIRLLIERGAILLRSGRDLVQPRDGSGLSKAQRQIARAEPLEVTRSGEAILREAVQTEQQVTREVLEERTLQAAVFGLLRSAMSQESTHGLDMVALPDEANSRLVVLSDFVSHDYQVHGSAMGIFDGAGKLLDERQGATLDINFQDVQLIETLDGSIMTDELTLQVEGSEAFTEIAQEAEINYVMDGEGDEARLIDVHIGPDTLLTSLSATTLLRMQEIIDTAHPITYSF